MSCGKPSLAFHPIPTGAVKVHERVVQPTHHAIRTRQGPLRLLCLAGLFTLLACALGVLGGQPDWQEALAQMPLRPNVSELNRTNCVEVMLDAFQSNSLVRALVFMPGATDEFYLFRRARAVLNNAAPTLLDAVCALTNQTFIHADFRPPFVILHTDEDPLEPGNLIQDQDTSARLRQRARVPRLECKDRDWDFLQPVLKRSLKIALRPWRYSAKSWHFYRHNFAAWNVDGLETLELTALAGKSKFVLRHHEATFEVDARVRAAPSFDVHLN